MTATDPSQTTAAHGPDKAITLALNLAHAERALSAFAAGQADAVVDAEGNAYLLRPAQAQLLRNMKRMESIIGGVADVLTVVSRGGLIFSQNRAVKHVFGFAPDELTGKMFFDYIHTEDIPQIHLALMNVIEGGRTHSTALFRHRTQEGSYRLVEATTGLLQDDFSPRLILSMRPLASTSSSS